MIEFFILVPVLVAQSRQITEHCGSSWKTASTFPIEELFIRKPAFDHHTIVFVLYEAQVIIMLYKLRQHKCRYAAVLKLLRLSNEFNIEPFFRSNLSVRSLDILYSIKYNVFRTFHNSISMG